MFIPNLEITNATNQSVAINGLVNLGNITRSTTSGCGCEKFYNFANGGNTLTLNGCGIYLVEVEAVFSGQDAGVATFTIQENNVATTGTASETITTADTEIRSVDFSKIIRVLPNTKTSITVIDTGIATTITNFVIKVLKLK